MSREQKELMMYKENVVAFDKTEGRKIFTKFYENNVFNLCYHDNVVSDATDAMLDKVTRLCDVLMHDDIFHKIYAIVLDNLIGFDSARYTKKLEKLMAKRKHSPYAQVYADAIDYIDQLDRTVMKIMNVRDLQ